MTLIEIIQVIQDYFPERIHFGTMPSECTDLEHVLNVDARRIAFAINHLACEYAAIEDGEYQ